MSHRFGPCQLDGCSKPKHRFGRYCQRHRKAYAAYGHPLGCPIDPLSAIPWAAKARLVINEHADTHAGIKLAIEELSRALKEATERDKVAPPHLANPRGKAATDRRVVSHFARLASQGVSALDVLTMIAAVALLDHTEPGRFPDTRAYRYGVARAVLGLVPGMHGSSGILGSNTLAAVGGHLTERYAVLMGHVVNAVLHSVNRDTARRVAMSVPLQFPQP